MSEEVLLPLEHIYTPECRTIKLTAVSSENHYDNVINFHPFIFSTGNFSLLPGNEKPDCRLQDKSRKLESICRKTTPHKGEFSFHPSSCTELWKQWFGKQR